MSKKIVIITTGQPSTNPRMVKEYEALKEEGYQVKVLYSFWVKWAEAADKILFETEQIDSNDFILIGGSPSYQKWKYYYSRIRSKIYKVLSLQRKEYALFRTAFFLENAALQQKADLYIAHNLGAVTAALRAAKKYNAKAGFDAEDYHRGEYLNQNCTSALMIKHIEDKYLPKFDYITAASPLICTAYKKLFPSKNITCINNVFSKKYLQKLHNENDNTLKLFWFSQTAGPGRGLETAVKAIEILKEKCKVELHIMGNCKPAYKSALLTLTTRADSIYFLPPVTPNKVFETAARFDAGLSLEMPDTENRDVCLTNKIFTYLLAGNCILFSNTKAQKNFFNLYPGIGYLFDAGNEIQLAEILLHLSSNRKDLAKVKECSLRVAKECLNWENESQKFKVLVRGQVNIE